MESKAKLNRKHRQYVQSEHNDRRCRPPKRFCVRQTSTTELRSELCPIDRSSRLPLAKTNCPCLGGVAPDRAKIRLPSQKRLSGPYPHFPKPLKCPPVLRQ